MRLVLVGAPGSGKGTQAELLVRRLGLAYVGTGAILRDARGCGHNDFKIELARRTVVRALAQAAGGEAGP